MLRTLHTFISFKFKCRSTGVLVNNSCSGDYILVDNEKKSLSAIQQCQDVRKQGRWSEAAFTEYILMAGMYMEELDELGDALACYYFAKNNGRYVHLLEGKKRLNSMTGNKPVKGAKDTLVLLETFVVLREEQTMPNGQDPLKASKNIDHDVTEFNFVCSSDPNKLPI
jgi:hypothetical protein